MKKIFHPSIFEEKNFTNDRNLNKIKFKNYKNKTGEFKMKKLISALIIAALVLVCGFAESAPKSMAVATFDINNNAVSKDDAEAVTELYIAELVSSGKVDIVDRNNFNKLLKEMQFQTSDWANSEKTVKLGTATGAQVISRGQIIKLGSKMYLSATVIDVNTAGVVSSAKIQFDSIDSIFDILPNFVKTITENLSLKIGDIGPGGGLICNIEGGRALECSEVLGFGTRSWAKEICAEYRGGGYDDWYLPSREELNFIYVNLKLTGKIIGNSNFWSSSFFLGFSSFWVNLIDFRNGRLCEYVDDDDKVTASVRAVRSFTIDN